VGDQAIFSSVAEGNIWQKAGGATGTVTSVAVTESGDSLNITGSPITTSGTINIGFNGTNLQYVNGAGNLTTFPTLMTSVGLTMPSAFTVTNSPLTGAGGTLAVTGAGVASQYIRGDGTLADFPSSGGGGSSVSYYLNGGTSQGTIGGTTYYEMSKTAVIGTGVDFAKSGDGFIVAFLTDANDPAQLNIPAGNWNYEIYASMSSNGGTPQMYAELYVYDGTTFTLIATSSNEIIYDGTALNLYTFAMAVPATSLTLTDRLAVKLYATNSGGKTTTIHTQDGHLCQIITTFSTGITALNGLTAQVQYFQTGTSGTDFNISSTTATHTFNIPSASATNRGLITTGTQTIAGSKTFTATLYGTDSEFSGSVLSPIFSVINGTKVVNLQSLATLNRDIYLPDASGTIALTSALANYVDLTTAQTIGGTKTFNDATKNNGGIFLQNASSSSLAGYMNLGGLTNGVKFTSGGGVSNTFTLPSATGYTFTFPNATGTLALTSDIPVNPITGTGTSGQVAYFNGTSSLTSNAAFAFTPTSQLLVNNSVTAASAIARGTNLTPTLVAAANSDVLVGLDINPTFTNGAFTGVTNWAARFQGRVDVGANFIGNLPTNQYLHFTGGSGEYRFVNGGGSGWFYTWCQNSSTTERMRLSSSNNLLIGTTTDAGFRLDVNGTARVQSNTTILGNGVAASLSVQNATGGAIKVGTIGASNEHLIIRHDQGGATTSTIENVFGAAAAQLRLRAGGNNNITTFGSGNTMFNSITDSGFRVDINGNARIQQYLQITGNDGVNPGISLLDNNTQGAIKIGNPIGTSNQHLILRHDTGGQTVSQIENTFGAANAQFRLRVGGNNNITMFGSGNTSINSVTDVTSAILHITSTTKGFLPPRMTTTQRTAISSPAEGLIVVQTDGTQGLYLYIGAAWHSITML
jgi:hypothetical protein